MTELTLNSSTSGDRTTRPRISLSVLAGVARLMALKPADAARTRARSRGSPPGTEPGSVHLRADIGLARREDEWWRAIDRW
jgi:hypothetical protein